MSTADPLIEQARASGIRFLSANPMAAIKAAITLEQIWRVLATLDSGIKLASEICLMHPGMAVDIIRFVHKHRPVIISQLVRELNWVEKTLSIIENRVNREWR